MCKFRGYNVNIDQNTILYPLYNIMTMGGGKILVCIVLKHI